jgi:hypothetical protein
VSSAPAWQPLLRSAQPCDHIVQLYTDDGFLTRAVSQFIGAGLLAGEAAVIVATPSHIRALDAQLGLQVEVAAVRARDQLVVFDAETCLAGLLVDGRLDRDQFLGFVNETLDRAEIAGNGRVRVFGEMVNLLCGRDPQAAAELEALWSGVLTTRSVCLLCAYRLDNFDRHVHRGLLHQISRSHSHVVPVEHYERLESAVDRVPRGLRGRGRHRLAPRSPRRRDRSDAGHAPGPGGAARAARAPHRHRRCRARARPLLLHRALRSRPEALTATH